MTNLTVYDYRVTAVNALGEGPPSNIGTAVPASDHATARRVGGAATATRTGGTRARRLLGWQGEGAHRLGAAYLGIPVCGPRPGVDLPRPCRGAAPARPCREWDSAEFAFRFMNQVYGVTPYAAAPKDVVRNYTSGAGGGLQFVANGTAGTRAAAGRRDLVRQPERRRPRRGHRLGRRGRERQRRGADRRPERRRRRLAPAHRHELGRPGLRRQHALRLASRPAGPGLGCRRGGNGARRAGARSGDAGPNSVTLTWTTPASGGSPITGYTIYRGTSSGTETLLTTVGLVNTYTDTTAVNSTTYFYKVTAVNALGQSALSNERSATPSASNDVGIRTDPVAPTVVVPRPPEPTPPAITQRPPKP